MAEILKKDDFRRVELLNLVTKNGSFKNLSDDQLILLDKLLKKKDYSNEKKAEKSKQKLLKQINIEIYKRNDTAIWKI
ncbi:MAG: hypothetical protein HOM82_02595 [Thaumarchaeota archaeon]|jgi:hypothetical protein|nr:hypothetical protein [Nitrososphaerota archaeon]MDC0052476.1 hypothetical protein [Candidatus Nitrosopelagicus sp.]MBT3743512.1 hypothetical protein [Nitrososphaerota archaeon]MBT4057425.1 hypothetical protein [Nitrososphaerota archaeon]MBT4176296.1 hypothetical protein [Nitrososphaerota archaeon]|tara:strand:+ start:434 stop:667 length:234 start_codon:yes stop_codon:yes gene_type:complete